jgi:hypothetical protein
LRSSSALFSAGVSSAAAASLYAGGAITAGTLAAVFLSTSDELIPVLLSEKAPLALISKILFLSVIISFLRHILSDILSIQNMPMQPDLI